MNQGMNQSTRDATCDKWKINARQRAPRVEAQVKRCHLSSERIKDGTLPVNMVNQYRAPKIIIHAAYLHPDPHASYSIGV